MKNKVTHEYVYNYFKEYDYKLITIEYKDSRSKLKIQCPNNHEYEVSFTTFKTGRRCKICSNIKLGLSRKLTYEYVYNYFKEQNCELLETEYINSNTKMKYRCKCMNISKINFNSFKNGRRCLKCSIIRRKEKRKHSYKYIKNIIESTGYILLSTQYKNANEKIKIRCKNDHEYEVTFASFQVGRRCRKCAGKEKYTYKYIYNYFKEQECELLETEYKNIATLMKYRCKNNHITKTRFNRFLQGDRCRKCWDENNTGENHSNWNHNREEIKISRRIRKTFKKSWIKNNLQQDPNYNNYIIDTSKFHIDHIIPVSLFSKFVIEYNLDEQEVKNAINKKENLQLLTKEDNMTKSDNGSIFEAAQYLMLNRIKLMNI